MVLILPWFYGSYRVYILILPWFYGPYFAYVSSETNSTFAVILSCLTSIVLIGLINVQRSLEDPFTEEGIDSIRVKCVYRTYIHAHTHTRM
jgi:hypothetical protein